MILYDISMTINREIAVYKNRAEKKPVFKVTSNFQDSSVYETRLDMDLHTGTHIDMPLHIYPDGAASEKWSQEEIFTRCVVLDFTTKADDAITAGKERAGKGLFIQLTSKSPQDVPIPEQPGKDQSAIDFGLLKRTQALGDRQALLEAGRKVISFHLGNNATTAINKLTELLD